MSRRREIMRSKSSHYTSDKKRSPAERAYRRKRALPALRARAYARRPEEMTNNTNAYFGYTIVYRTGERLQSIRDVLPQEVMRNECGDPTVLSRGLAHSCPRPAYCPLPLRECGDYDWEE